MSGDGQWGKADVLSFLTHPPWEGQPQGRQAPPLPPPDTDDFLRHLAEHCPLDDAGNARRLIARHGGDLVHVDGMGWHAWTGTHWSGEEGARIAERCAAETAKRFVEEIPFVVQHRKIQTETAENFHKRVTAWAAGAANQGKVRSMLSAAERDLCRYPHEMDADPLLFVCQNTALRLHQSPDAAGQLVSAEALDRAAYATHYSPVEYQPDADCPRWRRFLEEVQPDPEVRLWLQRFCGYLLSGLTSEQIVLCCEGSGANGKSIFWLALRHILGNHAAAIAPASIARNDHKDGSAATPDLARLPGKRLGMVSEWKRGQVLDEGLMKAWTGGDPITVRKLHQAPFEFRPVLKLVFTWNTRPVVKAGDDGTWRRLRVLPWPVTIPPERQTPEHVLLAAFREEAPGILNWMLYGWRLWVERGLKPEPAVMTDVTTEFRGESDSVGLFLRERCSFDADAWCFASNLFEEYGQFCSAMGVESISQTRFGTALSEKGYRKGKRSGVVIRKGLRVEQSYVETGG